MSFSTIILILLFLGISMYSKAKKTFAEQSVPMDDSADEVQGKEDVFYAEEEDSLQQENSYFTYEAETVEPSVYETRRTNPQPVMATAVEETPRQQFDLRQAVISQVILSNKYINGINQ